MPLLLSSAHAMGQCSTLRCVLTVPQEKRTRRFSFFEATAVYRASDAVTMVAYVGCCVGSGTGGGGRVIVCK